MGDLKNRVQIFFSGALTVVQKNLAKQFINTLLEEAKKEFPKIRDSWMNTDEFQEWFMKWFGDEG